MAYNVDEIKRFGVRLEEQASNFDATSTKIYDNLMKICAIFKKYEGEDAQALAVQTYNMGEGWNSKRADITQNALLLSANFLGFYESTSHLQRVAREELKTKFTEFYAKNPDIKRTNTSMDWVKLG